MIGRDTQILATWTADSMMLYVHSNRTVYYGRGKGVGISVRNGSKILPYGLEEKESLVIENSGPPPCSHRP